jgi:hypothetical protein
VNLRRRAFFIGPPAVGAEPLELRQLLWLAGRDEGIARVQSAVAAEGIGDSVRSIGAGPNADIDDGPGLPAVFRLWIFPGYCIEFLDRTLE